MQDNPGGGGIADEGAWTLCLVLLPSLLSGEASATPCVTIAATAWNSERLAKPWLGEVWLRSVAVAMASSSLSETGS